VTQWRYGCYEAKCVQRRCFQWGSVPLRSDIKGTKLPQPMYWYHSKGNWLRYNSAADSFYIIKLCSRLFVLHCRNCPKATMYERRQIWVPDPHFEEVRGVVEPWLMARWKARVRLPIRHNWTFYSAPQCSDCKRCTSYGNSVRLSVRPSVTRRYCVKTTARSTVQFALSDSKMCLVL